MYLQSSAGHIGAHTPVIIPVYTYLDVLQYVTLLTIINVQFPLNPMFILFAKIMDEILCSYPYTI